MLHKLSYIAVIDTFTMLFGNKKNSDQYVCTFKQRLTNDQSLSQGNRDWPVTSLSTRETDWPLIETDQWSVSRPEKQRLTTDQSFGQRNKDWPLISLSARETETDRWPVTRPEKLRSLSLTKVSSFSPPPPGTPGSCHNSLNLKNTYYLWYNGYHVR